jgi:hypothetical protein
MQKGKGDHSGAREQMSSSQRNGGN